MLPGQLAFSKYLISVTVYFKYIKKLMVFNVLVLETPPPVLF